MRAIMTRRPRYKVLWCVVAVVLAWPSYYAMVDANVWRREQRVVKEIKRHGGLVEYRTCGPEWIPVSIRYWSQVYRRVSAVHLRDAVLPVDTLEQFEEFANCEVIDLTGNANADESLRSICKMKRLAELNLSRSSVTDSGIAYLRQSRSVRRIDCEGTRITGSAIACLGRNPGLTHLNIRDCRISDAGVASLSEHLHLEYLILAGTDVGDEGISALGESKELRYLNCADTRLSDAGLEALRNSPRLETLILDRTGVSNKGLRTLEEITGLRYLSVSDLSVSSEGLKELIREMPNCSVETDSRRYSRPQSPTDLRRKG